MKTSESVSIVAIALIIVGAFLCGLGPEVRQQASTVAYQMGIQAPQTVIRNVTVEVFPDIEPGTNATTNFPKYKGYDSYEFYLYQYIGTYGYNVTVYVNTLRLDTTNFPQASMEIWVISPADSDNWYIKQIDGLTASYPVFYHGTVSEGGSFSFIPPYDGYYLLIGKDPSSTASSFADFSVEETYNVATTQYITQMETLYRTDYTQVTRYTRMLDGVIIIIVGVVLIGVSVTFERRRKVPTSPPQPPLTGEVKVCPTCGNPLTFVQQYNRWYCTNCKKYT
ncbi:MAG TPA: hypothetical protein VED00_03320 [archaeon]|nr:hypothetical protein [archaeon]